MEGREEIGEEGMQREGREEGKGEERMKDERRDRGREIEEERSEWERGKEGEPL